MANKIKLAGTSSNTFGIGLSGATISSESVSSPYTLTLPSTTGSNAQVLTTDGLGNLSWTTPTGGGGGDANYANFAGTIINSSQPNITSTGTLTSLNVTGNVTASRFISNVATGTAPFVVTSTTTVANLAASTASVAGVGTTVNVTSVGSTFTNPTFGFLTDTKYLHLSTSTNGNLNTQAMSTLYLEANAFQFTTTPYTLYTPAINANGAFNSTGSITSGGYGQFTGDLYAPTVQLSATTGTAPLAVNSTTRVNNLNVARAGVADVANSVAVANVVGIGNIATTNYNGNGSQVLAGNGAWVAQSGGGGSSQTDFAPALLLGGM